MKKRTGPKPIEWPQEARDRVAALAGYGLPEEKVCLLVVNPRTRRPITVETLHKHFPDEMANGRAKAWAQTLQTAYNLANGVREVRVRHPDGTEEVIRKEVRPDKGMNIWIQKTQMGMIDEESRRRLAIAERVAEIRGILDTGEDPHDTARRIRAELNKLEAATSGSGPDRTK